MAIIREKADVPYDEKALNDITDPELKRVADYIIELIKFLRQELFEIRDAINVNADPAITVIETATYSIIKTDDIIHVAFSNTGTATVTLTTAETTDDRTITIKDADGNAGVNNITIDTEGTETIDGSDTFLINVNFSSVDLYSIGSNWFIY